MPTVKTNGIEMYYERHGDGKPLVLLHGATSDHQLWRNQVDSLSDEYEVITYDMRGHGKTGGSTLPRYTVDLYADDLRAFINALELDSPYICGLSMGGMTALTYATRYPDELSALVVAGTVTPETQTLKEFAVMRGLYPVLTKFTGLLGRDRIQSVTLWAYDRIFDKDVDELVSEAEEIREQEVELEPGEYEKIMDAVTNYRKASLLLENVSVPTLVLYGETEPFIREHLHTYRLHIPDVEIQEIPDAGHNSHIENPEAFTTALRDFLGTLE